MPSPSQKRPPRRLPVPRGATTLSVTCRVEGTFALRSLGLVQCGPRMTQAEHEHDAFEVHYVRMGGGTTTLRGRPFHTRSGDVYFFQPRESHGGWTDLADPAQICYLSFTLPEDLRPAAVELCRRSPLLAREGIPELRAAMAQLADELSVLGSDARQHVSLDRAPASVVARALHVVAAVLEPLHQARPLSGTPRERQLAEAALRRLETLGLQPRLSIEPIARSLGVSAAYLGATLRKVTGKTFPDLVAGQRLQRARELLSDEGLPIREVARRVGLSGPRALAKLFRRLTGKTPASFRK